MKPYSYLLILFLSVIVCFVASFHRRIRFDKHIGTFLLSATIVAIPFLAWDVWFTHKGIWWFNMGYTLSVNLGGLPLEEWLFFICIPFACVFTYFCIEKFFDLKWTEAFNNMIVFVGLVICGAAILLFSTKAYTLLTSVVTLAVLMYLHFIAKKEWIGSATFIYILLLPGFFAVNGPLTGLGMDEAIVNYNSSEMIGKRILTIPVEDAFYGFSLFLLNIHFFKLFQEKRNKTEMSWKGKK